MKNETTTYDSTRALLLILKVGTPKWEGTSHRATQKFRELIKIIDKDFVCKQKSCSFNPKL